MVWLAGLIADHVARARVASPRASLSAAWRALAAVSSLSSASGTGSTRPAEAVLGSSWSSARPTDVDPSLADSYRPLAEIDVIPTQARDFAASSGRQEQGATHAGCDRLRCRSDGCDLIGGEGLEFPGLARHAINQSGNVSRQAPFGNELREHLRQSAEHVVARARAPRLARSTARPLQAAGAQFHDQVVDVSAGQVLDGQVAKLAADGLQDVFVARGRGGSDLVARRSQSAQACSSVSVDGCT